MLKKRYIFENSKISPYRIYQQYCDISLYLCPHFPVPSAGILVQATIIFILISVINSYLIGLPVSPFLAFWSDCHVSKPEEPLTIFKAYHATTCLNFPEIILLHFILNLNTLSLICKSPALLSNHTSYVLQSHLSFLFF